MRAKWPVVIVEWDDARGGAGGWTDTRDFETPPGRCYTAGFLYENTKEHVTVVSNLFEAETATFVSDATIIPKGCIVRITKQRNPASK